MSEISAAGAQRSQQENIRVNPELMLASGYLFPPL